MWVAIHLADSMSTADKLVQMLSDEGFLVRVRPVYKMATATENNYEILVLKSEACDARNTLMLNGY